MQDRTKKTHKKKDDACAAAPSILILVANIHASARAIMCVCVVYM